MPRLHDGSEVDSYSEAWRHECEARWILALPSLEQRRAWLQSLQAKRGAQAVQRLKTTMEALWRARAVTTAAEPESAAANRPASGST